jgi:hypothetical protein
VSVLLPSTLAVLRTMARVKQPKRTYTGEQREQLAELGEWLRHRPHVPWCQCTTCKARRELAEAGKLSEELRAKMARDDSAT